MRQSVEINQYLLVTRSTCRAHQATSKIIWLLCVGPLIIWSPVPPFRQTHQLFLRAVVLHFKLSLLLSSTACYSRASCWINCFESLECLLVAQLDLIYSLLQPSLPNVSPQNYLDGNLTHLLLNNTWQVFRLALAFDTCGIALVTGTFLACSTFTENSELDWKRSLRLVPWPVLNV